MAININWDALTFAMTPTKTMYKVEGKPDGEWGAGEFIPFGNISLSPVAGVLNYGQGCFEGLKAYRTKNESIVLFRPIENGKRMNESAKRLCMKEFPPEKFVDIVKQLVLENEEYIPPYRKGSLYVRPILFGSGPILGVSPAPEYTLLIYVSPVGPYFKSGFKPIHLIINTDFHRAAPGGIGGVKAIGNYSGSLLPGKLAKADGFAECLYVDAKHDKYIEEVGAANFFAVINNKMVTPTLKGTILPGITRKSVLELAQKELGMEVEEREISYEEVAASATECFCSGTAAIIASIGSFTFEGTRYSFNNEEVGPITKKLYDALQDIQLCDRDDPYNWVVKVK